jgi:peptide-methionine (S)-S-oxide reductase
VHVVFDPKTISLQEILKIFWEGHDPTQGMRQGNDMGTQYRSAIYYSNETLLDQIKKSEANYNEALKKEGYPEITTEILPLKDYFYAEDYHQQYLAKNPNGYCGIGGCGVRLPD